MVNSLCNTLGVSASWSSAFSVGSTGGKVVDFFTGDESGLGVSITATCVVGSTVASSLSMVEESVDVIKLSQAVNYVETYNQEEINDLVNQIDLILAENDVNVNNQDVYVRSLKK